MNIKAFWLPQILVIICILALGSVSMVYADAHGAGEAMEMEEESGVSGWFRTDTDSLGTQIWFGGSYPMGSISIDSDIYVVGSFAEFDLGIGIPAVDSDSLSLTFLPMVGIGFQYANEDGDATPNGPNSLIAPQLFTYLTAGSIYFESWIQGFFNTPFDYGDDSLYTRNFLLYSVTDNIAIGPQVEVTTILAGLEKENEEDETETGLSSLVVGGRINMAYGENNTLGLFVGIETQLDDDSEDTGITGRMTFVRTW